MNKNIFITILLSTFGVLLAQPDWVDDPGAYEFTASMTAGVYDDSGAALGDYGDMLAAFDAEGNVRGISTMLDGLGPSAGLTLHAITIRSNAAGDEISFQYYDASANIIHYIQENYSFDNGALLGNQLEPHELHIGVALSIEIDAGWNWFSINVEGEDMSPNTVLANLNPALNDQIKSQEYFAVYIGEEYGGWSGTMNVIDPKSMYMIKISNAGNLEYAGAPINPESTPININAGWNWIGYLPQGDLPINDALGTVVAALNDQIKSQEQFAVYIGEEYGGWSGTMIDMTVGVGYMMKVSYDSELTYPNGSDMSRMDVSFEEEKVLPSVISSWAVNPQDQEFTATMTLSIDNREDVYGDYVGVFVDGECRGIADQRDGIIDDNSLYSVMVYSNVVEGEKLTFKYYSSLDKEIINYDEVVDYTANENYGNDLNTYGLVREAGTYEKPDSYGLGEAYPNPFNPVTSFALTLEVDGMVEVVVYDLNGRQVAELVNGYMSAGSYPVVWDAKELSSGVYMVNMIAGEYSSMQKVMLIK